MSLIGSFDAIYSKPVEIKPVEIKILWDYEAGLVVDGGNVRCSLFDTLHVYMFMADSALPWRLSRYPGEHVYVAESAVPELVRLAALVST